MAQVTDDDIQIMLDVFSGADGGGKFVLFRARYQDIVAEAELGSPESKKIVEVFTRATKLVELLSGPIPGEDNGIS